jgi:hypothetical protein
MIPHWLAKIIRNWKKITHDNYWTAMSYPHVLTPYNRHFSFVSRFLFCKRLSIRENVRFPFRADGGNLTQAVAAAAVSQEFAQERRVPRCFNFKHFEREAFN